MSLIKDIEIIELGDVEKEDSSPWSSTVVLIRMVTSDGFVGYGEAPTTMMTRGVYEQAKKHSNIIGIKDSSGNFRSIAAFINSMPRGFSVFQGEDDLLLPSLMLGASGCVCGTTNFSDLAVQVYKKFKEGEINSASQLQSRLDAVMGAVNSVQFPSGYCFAFSKFVMRGAEVGCVPPIGKPSPKEKASIYSQLKGMF